MEGAESSDTCWTLIGQLSDQWAGKGQRATDHWLMSCQLGQDWSSSHMALSDRLQQKASLVLCQMTVLNDNV